MKKYVLSAALFVALFISCDKDDNSGGGNPIYKYNRKKAGWGKE